MNFLRKINDFLMPPNAGPDGDIGLYYYVRCNRCGEVIKVRVNPHNDLSIENDVMRFVHKTIVGQNCYSRIEAEFQYDSRRRLNNVEIEGGAQVTKAEYDAFLAKEQG